MREVTIMLGMKRYALPLFALLVAAGATAQSVTDTLTLISGEILRGELLEIDDGVVTFRTRHGSRTFLPADQIQAMSTAEPRRVTLNDGRTVTGRLTKEGEQFTIASESVSISDVTELERVAKDKSKLAASVESGILFREGDKSRADLYARIELNRNEKWYAWNARTLVALDRGDGFPRYLRSEFDWRKAPGDQRAPFFLASVERDLDSAIAMRAFMAAGLEQRFLAGANLRVGAGVGGVYDDFDAGDAIGRGTLNEVRWRFRNRGFADALSKRDTAVALLLRVMYDTQLTDHLTFQDELRVMPSLSDFGEFRASYDSGLAWALLDGLELNLRLRIDYDDNPPFAGLEQWRAAIGAGLRVRFGTR